MAVIAFLSLKYTIFGRNLYVIGSGVEVARLSGIKVRKMFYMVYCLCGILCGVAGVMLAARINSAVPTGGEGYEMDAIAAAVIGGAIRTAGNLLGHFHTGECNRMVPGKGRTPWKEIGEALSDIGYQKRVVMEPFVTRGGQVGQDIKVWRELMGNVTEAALDRDAKEALRFQRYMLDGTMEK